MFFQECDILEDLTISQCSALKKTYDVVVDKVGASLSRASINLI